MICKDQLQRHRDIIRREKIGRSLNWIERNHITRNEDKTQQF